MSFNNRPAEHAEEFRQILIAQGKGELFPENTAERYPHILEKIFLVWHEPKVAFQLFFELLTSDRENRAGFPAEIYTEIFRLESYYTDIHPHVRDSDKFYRGANKK